MAEQFERRRRCPGGQQIHTLKIYTNTHIISLLYIYVYVYDNIHIRVTYVCIYIRSEVGYKENGIVVVVVVVALVVVVVVSFVRRKMV